MPTRSKRELIGIGVYIPVNIIHPITYLLAQRIRIANDKRRCNELDTGEQPGWPVQWVKIKFGINEIAIASLFLLRGRPASPSKIGELDSHGTAIFVTGGVHGAIVPRVKPRVAKIPQHQFEFESHPPRFGKCHGQHCDAKRLPRKWLKCGNSFTCDCDSHKSRAAIDRIRASAIANRADATGPEPEA